MNCLTDEVRRGNVWDKMFADSVELCTVSRDGAEEKLEDWTRDLETRGTNVSGKKTKYFLTGGGHQQDGSISQLG